MGLNILYSAIEGTSGYAEAAKNYMLALAEKHNVHFSPDRPDCAAGFADEGLRRKRIEQLKKPLSNYDVLIMHHMPDRWQDCYEKNKHYNFKKVIGLTVWETSKLHPHWTEYCNYSWLDEVWVPVEWNKATFAISGVKTTMRVIPHIYMEEETTVFDREDGIAKKIRSLGNAHFVYYTIGQWNERKGIPETIRAFCEAFKGNDTVCLVVKTFCEGYTAHDEAKCRFMLHDILKDYKKPPKVVLITDNLQRKYIELMHKSFHCFVSLCKSEGWGLGAFEAAAHGNSVVITGYGGQLEFLPKEHTFFIQYGYEKVKDMSHLYWLNNQVWAKPNMEDATNKIKQARLSYMGRNEALERHIKSNYSMYKIAKMMENAFDKI